VTSVQRAHALDAADPLAAYRGRYADLDGRIHLSATGRAAHDTIAALRGAALTDDWPAGPGSRVSAQTRASHAADAIAPLIGALPGQVVLTADTVPTTVVRLTMAALRARPHRRVIVTSDDGGSACLHDWVRHLNAAVTACGGTRRYELHVIEAGPDGITADAIHGRDVAVAVLPHAYDTGALADMAGITQAAHDAGALTLWDLTHTTGAMQVRLAESGADLAAGATHTHLAAGPGAPAYLYARDLDITCSGSPSPLHTSAALHGARLLADAGIDKIHDKAKSLTSYAISLVDAWLRDYRVRVESPRDPHRRTACLALRHPAAVGIAAALARIGITVDQVPPDRIRITTHPLNTRHLDVHHAITGLRDVLASRAYDHH
jgi:kynureninase